MTYFKNLIQEYTPSYMRPTTSNSLKGSKSIILPRILPVYFKIYYTNILQNIPVTKKTYLPRSASALSTRPKSTFSSRPQSARSVTSSSRPNLTAVKSKIDTGRSRIETGKPKTGKLDSRPSTATGIRSKIDTGKIRSIIDTGIKQTLKSKSTVKPVEPKKRVTAPPKTARVPISHRPKPLAKPVNLETKPLAKPVKQETKTMPKPVRKVKSRPASPVKNEPVQTIGSKTPSGRKRLSMDPTKRRRTRFSMNKAELENQLTEWQKNTGKKTEKHEEMWADLAKSDTEKKQEHILVKSVEEMIEYMFVLKFPHLETWDMLEDLRTNFPNVDIRLFACYWKAKCSIAMRIGKPEFEIMEILEQGENSQPAAEFEQYVAEVKNMYQNDPNLASGQILPDPEMTALELTQEEEGDVELELSIVFDPPFEPAELEKEPVIEEAVNEIQIERQNATFLRLMVSLVLFH